MGKREHLWRHSASNVSYSYGKHKVDLSVGPQSLSLSLFLSLSLALPPNSLSFCPLRSVSAILSQLTQFLPMHFIPSVVVAITYTHTFRHANTQILPPYSAHSKRVPTPSYLPLPRVQCVTVLNGSYSAFHKGFCGRPTGPEQ